MVFIYLTACLSRNLSLLTITLLLGFTAFSFGQIGIQDSKSSSLSITGFDSSYVNNNLSSFETFNGGASGALIVAMDNNLQSNGSGYFNTYSYGLVVALLHADVPVKWAISSTKIQDGTDFSANAKKVAPSVGSTNNYDFKSGPILIHPGYEDQALSVINTYNNNLSSTNKVKVYRLTTTTSIEIRHTLFHKPKAAILNNGNEQQIHENVFQDAGLVSGTHYLTNLNASDIDGTSCVTMVCEPHADNIDAQDVIGVRDFVTNGGNFFAQCAAIRRYEGYGTNQRLLTSGGLNDEDQASGSIFYDNPNDPVFQIQGTIRDEGGSIQNFRILPSNLQSGTSTKRYAYFSSGSENDFKFYGGKAANVITVSGGNVFYLAGHKYENGAADKINGRRLLLNTLLIPPSRPPSCGLVISEPDIALVKTGQFVDANADLCANVGETIAYTFTVTNQGSVSLSNIILTDALLASFVFVSGDTNGDSNLDISETWNYSGVYSITQSDIDAGLVTNTATVQGVDFNATLVSDVSGDTVTNNIPTVTDLCQDASIALIKLGTYNGLNSNGDCISAVGDTIAYSFSVTNTGNVTLTNTVVSDPLVTMVGGPIASLAPGITDATTYTASYVITQQDIDAGVFSNQATATATAPDATNVTDVSGTSITNDTPTDTPICQNDAIAIVKTGVFNDIDASGCSTALVDTVSYTFTVTNQGNTPLTGVTVIDPLLGGLLTSVPSGDTNNDTILDVTETWVYVQDYSVTQDDVDTGSITNQATASGTGINGVVTDLSDDNSFLQDDPTITDLCQNDSIALIKTGFFNDANGNNCADVNETITYSFRVVNTGNTAITNINIDDALVNVQGGPISLNPGQEDTTTFTATYLITQVDINIGSVTNTAIVAGLNPDGVVVSDISDNDTLTEDDPTVTLLCNNAVIALIKTGVPGDENGNGCVDLGETIVYDFVVTNLGNVTLTQVIVTDPMVVVQGGSVTLLPGVSDTETFSAVYTVTQDDVEAGLVSNQAIAEGLDPSGNVVNDLSDDNSNFENDSTTTILCQDPSIFVEKAGVFNDENGNFIPEPGETISYVFVVTNTGNLSVFNITLEDPLPGIVISGGPITSLAPGEIDTTTFTASYAITSADIEAGEVINQAVVRGITAGGEDLSDTSDDPNDPTDTDPDGDGDPDDPTITILPNVLTAVFEIFNAVSADGNGENDFFFINGISEWPDNNVQIFNRWGVKVYQTNGYGGSNDTENVFTGYSEGRQTVSPDKLLPAGTYYYIITFNGPDNPGLNSYAGYLYLNR